MKYSNLKRILVLEAIICLILVAVQNTFSWDVFTVTTWPLLAFSKLLRNLSLSSSFGNLLALLLYVLFCCLPLLLMLYHKKMQRLFAEDCLLALLSLELFVIVYLLINPASINMALAQFSGDQMEGVILAFSLYAVILAYAILHYFRKLLSEKENKIIRALQFLVFLGALVFVFACANTFLADFVQNIKQLYKGSEVREINFAVNYLLLMLQTLLALIPYIINVIIMMTVIKLLNHLAEDWLSDDAISLSRKLTRHCRNSLVFTLVGPIFLNLLQLLLMKQLLYVSMKVNLPLLEMIIVLACYVLSHFLIQSKKIREDNELFI